MISSLTAFVQSFGIAPAPAGIVAVLLFLGVVGLVAGVYQEAKLRKAARERRR
jgi:VIT1/CCC1 family predicted Fe2+/Mn2+ transporter